MTVLELRDVTRTYRLGELEVAALRGVDLAVARGERVVLVGPSGSGKSTVLHLAGALDGPTSGTVTVEGRDLAGLTPAERAALRRDRIGFVFQSYNLVPVMTAFENAAAVLALQGVSDRAQRDRVRELFDALGIAALADRRPDQLSGGQQQRVAVARALSTRPAVVLADEPTANLDSATAEQLLDVLARVQEEQEATFVISTHDERVQRHARRVVTLVDGRVASDVSAPPPPPPPAPSS